MPPKNFRPSSSLAKPADNRLTVGRPPRSPGQWCSETLTAIEHVYTPEILSAVNRVARGLVDELERIELSEMYLKNAGGVAHIRALEAGYRLAEVWRDGLSGASDR